MIDRNKDDHEILLYRVLFQSYKNNVIRIISKYCIKDKEEDNKLHKNKLEYCKAVLNAISENCAFTAIDVSVKQW